MTMFLPILKREKSESLNFDSIKFWSDFSTNFLIPESPILVAVPKQENKLFFDIVNSVNLGPYKLLGEFFNCLDRSKEQEIVEFCNDYGWWNDWHSTIFDCRWNVCLKFIERRAFIINKSLLGRDYLGLKTRRVPWEKPNMKFSNPSERLM